MLVSLIELWSVRLPRWADRWSPRLGDALADGAWTVQWPAVAAYAPAAALAVGFVSPILWPGMPHVYTESLLFMLLVVVGAIASGPVGVMLLGGYVIGRLLVGSRLSTRTWDFDGLVRELGGELISFVLLAILAVVIPLVAHRMARQIPLDRLPPDPNIRLAAHAALYGIGCGLLTYLWCQGTVVLIRPVFTWVHSQPTVEAISPVQVTGRLLVMAAAGAAAARVLVENFRVRRGPVLPTLMDLERRRRADGQRHSLWRRVPPAARIALATALVPLLLAGTYTSWIDAVAVAAATAGLGAWRAGLIGRMPAAWSRLVLKIPALVRVMGAFVIGQILANVMIGSWLARDSFRPVMLGALLTLATFYALFPQRRDIA